MDVEFLWGGQAHSVRLEKKGDRFHFSWNENTWEADIQPMASHGLSILLEGKSVRAYLAREGERIFVFCRGRYFELRLPSEDRDSPQAGGGQSAGDELQIKAPMPGKVIKIDVQEGDEVRKNQTLAVVEAMKMENEIKASIEAVVEKIHAAPGDLVDTDTPLIELAAKE